VGWGGDRGMIPTLAWRGDLLAWGLGWGGVGWGSLRDPHCAQADF